jgi:ATP-binding cassette subfamily B protein
VNGLVSIIRSAVSLLGIAGLVIVTLHWSFAALLAIAAVPGALFRLKLAEHTYRWQNQRTPTQRKLQYFDWLLTLYYFAKEVRLFHLGPLFIRRASEMRKQLRRERLDLVVRRSFGELVAQASATLAVFGAFAVIADRTLAGGMSLGKLVMYYQALQRGHELFSDMLRGLAGLYENSLFLSNFYTFLDLQPKVTEPQNPKPVPQPMRSGIVFDHVSFHYPSGSGEVLRDVNLTIRPGEVIALVGENGSGKTTLVKLLCRLYDPTSGKITLDGIDLREFRTSALQREFSVIFQDFVQYELSARENISLGNVDLAADHERILESARKAGAHDAIMSLPRSYETRLGKMFEGGEELSIGQWQKVALARAFMRDAQVIVLDEPTSAMDAKAEYEVFQKFRQLTEGRSAVLISHRLSTVRMADHIYVLEGGQIVESGTHGELIRQGATYASLFETQAHNYR